ncbi:MULTISPECIES: TlpA family protein disulfide reductase [Mycolicibacterium]|uniref:TlpA family protein disulfide reductase n=1 Tax=Mycolicibacterium TaxID=1866885 RepID=UPI0008DE61F5|nr:MULTISPECIES: redoxin domain-containing protein [Mycolicibacterium]WGI36022.1 redoxin domain-containing protein [Mycolicibacterium aubagnense]
MPDRRSRLTRPVYGVAAALLTAGALTACGPAATTSTTTPAPPTGAAAPAALTTVDGHSVDLPATSPTAVLFFSAGCGECVGGGTAVAGARAAVQKATGTARFLAVDMVPTENTADVHRFLDQIGDTNLPAVIDTHGDLTSRYQVTAQTTLLVIDPSGRITYRGHAPAQDQILTALGPSAAR